jgi:hypothetical protein
MNNQPVNENLSDQGVQKTSLAGYRIASFLIFFSVATVVGYLSLLCPLSAWAVYSDKTGSGSGYFIFGLLFLAFIPATPAGIVAGILSLPKLHPVLKTIISVVVGIALSWLFGWIMREVFFST